MKLETERQTTSSEFLKTDRGKTKSNTIEVPSISLPKGGGAIKGIDEKFSVNAVNGTASFSLPLPVSPARGVSPSLSLSYNSGAGNSIFGLGWSLSLSSLKRKTDKGLPQYIDAIDSDTFLLSEAEDLVAEFKKELDGSFSKGADGEYIINEKQSVGNSYTIRFYRPRIEGLFARIERWSDKTTGEVKWRVITKDNLTTLYGWSSASRITDPKDPSRIYEWLPEFVFDDKGNCAHYIYKKEDGKGFDASQLHNKNRTATVTYTNVYLDKVLYGNQTPYQKFDNPAPPDNQNDYLFSTVFDYGTLNEEDSVDKINDWDFRTDAYSDYRAGFDIRTTRLCKRVLLFHHFNGTNEYDGLVRSLNFEYDEYDKHDAKSQHNFTFLKSITTFGYIKKDGTYTKKNLPALEFAYQKHEWNKEVKTVATADFMHAPVGLDESTYQFTDLFNEGLAGILTEQVNGWYYKHNLGAGKFEQAKLVTPKPSFVGLGSELQLLDLDADGSKQLVSFNTEPKGYFEFDDDEWQAFRYFQNLPNINLGDANTRLIDLNGDGKPELVVSEDTVFSWYPSEGRNGYSEAQKTLKPVDEEVGPHIVFADQKQTIFLADMSGDGLTDIVRIRNGEVCYWPNLGYGKFGAKVSMDNAPFFDYPDSFNPAYLRLADIDGSGTTDIIYLGKNKYSCWKNLSGNAFHRTPFEIDTFPEIHNQSKISVTDLLGTGVACIVWSSSLSKDAYSPLRYIDLMNSKKPHVMVKYLNNLGKEVSLDYLPSTHFYLDDKRNGTPWVTKLHFPVHCISRTETVDKISGYRFISSYAYHHGYYDHAEREFRGFGMVEQTDSEDFDHWSKGNASNIVDATLHQEPVVSKTWFHTGAFMNREKILNQFAHEYWYEEMNRQGFAVAHQEVALPNARLIAASGIDPTLIDRLSTQEWQEALRACKGMNLRSEVFARDAADYGNTPEARQKELTPYTVATHNCEIELIQPKGKNKHAIFAVRESEAIMYSYERNPADPRIAHNLTCKVDQYGNVLESAAVVYPRTVTDPDLPLEIQQEQRKTVIIYTKNQFTNELIGDNTYYRLPLPYEVETVELKGVTKSTPFFTLNDFDNILNDTRSDVALYHEIDKPIVLPKAQRRLIEHTRTVYYKNNLTGPLPLSQLESMAIPYEQYQLAYTPELLAEIFETKSADAEGIMGEESEGEESKGKGKFCHSKNKIGLEDLNWWVRSGTIQFIGNGETSANAQARFYTPKSYTDPYRSTTKVTYDSTYYVFVEKTEDVLGNITEVDLFNFRTLSPQRMRDSNDNLTEAFSDELGLVKAIAVMGKGMQADELTWLNDGERKGLTEFLDDGEVDSINNFFDAPDSMTLIARSKDLLKHATARFVYDFDAYKITGKPAVMASIVREDHFQTLNDSPVQLSFEYSNGLGQIVMKKIQAEPGKAKEIQISIDGTFSVSTPDTGATVPKQLRWIGNGRTVLNNKGNPVKQYEPYFSVTHHYEDLKELVETGVTPLIYYDAPGRVVKTQMPDGTFSKTVFDSWKQQVYDANDTILESDWYTNRTGRLIDAQLVNEGKDPAREKLAADKAAKHANTPSVLHVDTLGRPILSVEHNRNVLTDADEYYPTRVKLDAEGNLRSVTDARGNTVMQYKYDMLGNVVYQESMDAGKRWLLVNILGNPLRTWDQRNHEFQYEYDTLHRPTTSKVKGGDGLNHIFDRIYYGEGIRIGGKSDKELNLRGKVYRHYDTGGLLESPEYDFKGQPIITTRTLFKHYKATADWQDANLITDLEGEYFTFRTETDALGRITRQTTPDDSIITPTYNETGLLTTETIRHNGSDAATPYINDIDYNEKGQREKITYGNNVNTRFYYDQETFRLKRLETKRQNGDSLQDLYFTYDPVGNITHIEDKSIPVIFFDNQKITGISTYTYDALYRLVEATGRENNVALAFGAQDNWSDAPFIRQHNPGDPMAMRNYTQRYTYDQVGNIRQMQQIAAGNPWTRKYNYEDENNRLNQTRIQGATYSYSYHPEHGLMTTMPHLEQMEWSFKEELVKTSRQRRAEGTPETTYYQYDSQGQRIRKITENEANVRAEPTPKDERIYVAGYERYKSYSGADAGLERVSLSLIDQGNRFVMIDIETKARTFLGIGLGRTSPKQLVRYQLHNHLESSSLELDGTADARVISYEEYHPYGTTAYQANDATVKAAAKRYRYTGMERDEETGLSYHSARYYMPWLGRWCSADPIGIGDGVNLYAYVNNPVKLYDTNGKAKGIPATVEPTTQENQQQMSLVDGVSLEEDLAQIPHITTSPLINGGELAASFGKDLEKSISSSYYKSIKGEEAHVKSIRDDGVIHPITVREPLQQGKGEEWMTVRHLQGPSTIKKLGTDRTSWTRDVYGALARADGERSFVVRVDPEELKSKGGRFKTTSEILADVEKAKITADNSQTRRAQNFAQNFDEGHVIGSTPDGTVRPLGMLNGRAAAAGRVFGTGGALLLGGINDTPVSYDTGSPQYNSGAMHGMEPHFIDAVVTGKTIETSEEDLGDSILWGAAIGGPLGLTIGRATLAGASVGGPYGAAAGLIGSLIFVNFDMYFSYRD